MMMKKLLFCATIAGSLALSSVAQARSAFDGALLRLLDRAAELAHLRQQRRDGRPSRQVAKSCAVFVDGLTNALWFECDHAEQHPGGSRYQ